MIFFLYETKIHEVTCSILFNFSMVLQNVMFHTCIILLKNFYKTECFRLLHKLSLHKYLDFKYVLKCV